MRFNRLIIIIIALTGILMSSCDIILNGGSGGNQQETPEVNKPQDGPKEFVLLFTNDFHSQIEPIDKNETYNADRGGAKRIKVLVDSIRNAEPAVVRAAIMAAKVILLVVKV